MRITKSQLRQIIKEEVKRIAEWGDDGVDYRSPATLLSQANDKLGEALEMMDGQGATIDPNYEKLVEIYEQISTVKDALVQAGRE